MWDDNFNLIVIHMCVIWVEQLKMKRMAMEAIACCKIYVSESRNQQALTTIARAASLHEATAPLLNTFPDLEYNRTGYTLASPLSQSNTTGTHGHQGHPLHSAVLDMVEAAFMHISLREHAGSHPRLGVIDHICFVPLGSATLPPVASIAVDVAKDIANRFAVPTYLYGAAHHENRPLDAIRRSLGYFSSKQGQWLGSTIGSRTFSLAPDYGPKVASLEKGVVVAGACPWVANYNIPILSDDLQLISKIAKKVSTRGGGLPGVQAMALLHGSDKIEVACNITDTKATCAEMVQNAVDRLAGKEGLVVLPGYFTDYSEEQMTEMAKRKLFGH